MSYVSLEKFYKKPEASVYKLVLTAAARANELASGASPLVKTHSKKVTTVSLEEIAGGVVRYDLKKNKKSKD